jgi:hypothetical protein
MYFCFKFSAAPPKRSYRQLDQRERYNSKVLLWDLFQSDPMDLGIGKASETGRRSDQRCCELHDEELLENEMDCRVSEVVDRAVEKEGSVGLSVVGVVEGAGVQAGLVWVTQRSRIRIIT